MRPLVLHLADNAMVEGLKGFFRRKKWHFALQCAEFDLDPSSARDFLKVPGANDQALWKYAHSHLEPFLATYERAIVMLDEWFDPSPGAEVIEREITERMLASGWARDRFEVIVIRPMLEAWLWMDSDHIADAFGWSDYPALKAKLIAEGFWRDGEPKPHDLKGAAARAAKLGKTKSGRRAFANVFSAVTMRSLNRCSEPGFHRLRSTLQAWFPLMEGGSE